MATLKQKENGNFDLIWTKEEIENILEPFIVKIFNKKVKDIAENITILLEENKNIRTELKGLNRIGLEENHKKINDLLNQLKKGIKTDIIIK